MSVKFSYPGTIPINDNRIARGYYTVAVFGYPPPPHQIIRKKGLAKRMEPCGPSMAGSHNSGIDWQLLAVLVSRNAP